MSDSSTPAGLRLALPKGRIQQGVSDLLRDAGINVANTARGYRPTVSMPGVEAKVLKPQTVVEMLATGTRDLGFAGADWVAELGADLVELLDTELDPVRLVLAAPRGLLEDGRLPARPLVVASEYERLTRAWFDRRDGDYRFVRSHGATEVFPPEDADCIVDNTSSGATLQANDLEIVEVLLRSSTRFYASRQAWEDPARRARIEDIVTLLGAVLAARRRVILEVNVSAAALEAVVALLPCLRHPTVAPLHGEEGYAVKAAVPRDQIAALIPRLRAAGGTDVLVASIQQIVV
ncbi:MAG: ATP phosphoribosyltransferase [Planctomycetota bacterium]